MMKLFSPILITLCLAVTTMSVQAERQPLDKIAAIVERSVVLQSEVDDRVAQVIANAQGNKVALPPKDVLEKQVLDHLITEQLQMTTAQRVNLIVTDEHVNNAIDSILANNKINRQQLEQQLSREGTTMANFREKLRRDITLQQIQQAMIQQRIQISPLEIDNFLKSAEAKFWISPEYHLGHILVSLPQAASAEDVEAGLAKAKGIVKKIRDGKAFAELAIAESDGPAALQGGDLGWRKTSALPSLFAEILPSLEVGQVSEPTRSPAGFHILKVYETRGDEQQKQEQVHARHILVKTSAIMSNEEAKRKLEKIRQDILAGADFAVKAKENSEDIGSMLGGGDLGWSNPDVYVPEFSKVVKNLPIGEISKPFKSQFGWHILQVQERRQEDITEAVLRDKAARILTSRRFEDELQIWLRELRDDAYVDVLAEHTESSE